jgi:hypothetical protein
MPKPTDGVKSSVVPQQAPSLEQKEAQKAKEQVLQQRISSSDQARIAQQAGFSRAARKKAKALDIGDSSRAPIPLPDDDVDNESWSSERLDTAQKSLGLATAQFEEIAEGEEAADIGEAVMGGSFSPTEQGVAQLEDLAQRSVPAAPTTSEMTANMERLFAIKLDEEVPIGHKLLAAGLVAAGESGWVSVDKGRLNANKLAAGIQKVTERSNQAVGEAQKNIKGIDRELNVQRTFVYKR